MDGIWGNHGSRRKSPAACRKVSVRNNWNQKHCGSLKGLNAAEMRMACHEKWHGAKKMSLGKPAPGTMWYKEPQKNGRSGGDSAHHNNVTVE
jgi:hypothetical protein